MFTLNHFILLFISAVVIFLYLFLNKKFNLTLKQNITILFIVSVISEIIKIFSNIVLIETIDQVTNTVIFDESGYYLDQSTLPFHLCAIQLILFVALQFFVKNKKTQDHILCFMFPTMSLGALIALFIPTEGVSFAVPQVYEYFLHHAFLVAFGINLIMSKFIKIDFKVILRNYGYLIGYMVICLWLNSALSYAHTNYMFLSRPPMENLPFLNLDSGWVVYFFRIFAVGAISVFLLQFPFALKNKKTINQRELI